MWIDASIRLPSEELRGCKVLVLLGDEITNVQYPYTENDATEIALWGKWPKYGNCFVDPEDLEPFSLPPTHWMKIPELTEGADENGT
jgi:hypothetical protein